MKQSELGSRVRRHPMILLIAVCLLAAATLDQTKADILSLPAAAAISILLLVCSAAYILLARPHAPKVWLRQAVVAVLLSGTPLFLYYLMQHSDNPAMTLMSFGIALLTFTAFYLLWVYDKITEPQLLCLILAAGFLLRLGYLLYTGINERQHDFHSFTSKNGHAIYIKYLLDHHHLPDFDPRTVFQFYHPPLYHTVAALWIKGCQLVGMSWNRATEALQFLTLFCSMTCLLTVCRIGQALGLKKAGVRIATLLAACHPVFFFLTGSVNNDIMSIAFALGAILWTIRWYQAPSFRRILAIALCIGLGMMTKLSVAMVAPAIALVFLAKLLEERKKPAHTLAQYGVFAAVCCPLGLWWSIRNLVLYHMPISYIPDLGGASSYQYNGDHSVFARLFGWDFGSVFVRWGKPYYDYRPIPGLLKTALFDEKNLTDYSKAVQVPCVILFYLSALLAVLTVVSLIRFICRKKDGQPLPIRVLFCGLYLLLFFSYLQLCFQYPYTCTMNARYVVPLIALGCVLIGDLVDRLIARKTKPAYTGATLTIGSVCLFCLMSAYIFIKISGGA